MDNKDINNIEVTFDVISAKKEIYDKWVKTFQSEDEQYVHVTNIEDCKGNIFGRVLKSFDWNLIDNSNEILADVIYRIRTDFYYTKP